MVVLHLVDKPWVNHRRLDGPIFLVPGPSLTAAIISGRKVSRRRNPKNRSCKIILRARGREIRTEANGNKETIIVHEIPYQVNQSAFILKKSRRIS